VPEHHDTKLPTWRRAPGATNGQFEGGPYGGEVSMFVVDAKPGDGPGPHWHPYTETFVLLEGVARFRSGDVSVNARAGDVVVVAPNTAHGFTALEPDGVRQLGVHASPRFVQTWLAGANDDVPHADVTLPTWREAPDATSGEFEGGPYGGEVTIIVVDAAPGRGPSLHWHPYTETFILREGSGRFRLGDETIEASAGDALVVPAEVPHGFKAIERLRMVAVHAAPRFETHWLDEVSPPAES
jgi:quercetin dioxygenase-like cupin family protein